LRADFGNLGLAEAGHRPVARTPGDVVHEVAEQFRAIGGVRHFGVELHTVVAPRFVGDGREGRTFAGGHNLEAFRQSGHAVAMAHPHLVGFASRPHALEQGAWRLYLHESAPKLAVIRRLHAAAQLRTHGLLAIADAQHRQAARPDFFGRARGLAFVHTGRPAGQDDAFGLQPRQRCTSVRERNDLAVNAGFAHPARDQLGHLGAEIDDENSLGRLHGGRLTPPRR
jgi:hypothetical protein